MIITIAKHLVHFHVPFPCQFVSTDDLLVSTCLLETGLWPFDQWVFSTTLPEDNWHLLPKVSIIDAKTNRIAYTFSYPSYSSTCSSSFSPSSSSYTLNPDPHLISCNSLSLSQLLFLRHQNLLLPYSLPPSSSLYSSSFVILFFIVCHLILIIFNFF